MNQHPRALIALVFVMMDRGPQRHTIRIINTSPDSRRAYEHASGFARVLNLSIWTLAFTPPSLPDRRNYLMRMLAPRLTRPSKHAAKPDLYFCFRIYNLYFCSHRMLRDRPNITGC